MSLNGPLGATQSGAFELRGEAIDARTRGSHSRVAVIALSTVVLAGTILVLAAAHTDSLLPESVRPIPAWLAGPLDASRLRLGVVALASVLALMFAGYVTAVRRADSLSARSVLMAIAALHALVLLGPPLVSTDIFSYQAYARMFALYGANPYVHGPAAIALDPVYPFIGAKWVSTPSAYGPVFTAFTALLAPLSIASSALVYKAIAGVSSLLVVGLVWNLARMRGVDPVKAAALVGLNPLIVLYGVGGGHNDLLMLALLMVAISLLLQHRERAGAASVVLAAGIKLTAFLVIPFAFANARSPLSRERGRELLIGTAVTSAAVAVVAGALFGTGTLHLLGTLSSSQSRGDWHSIPGLVGTRLGLGEAGHITGYVLGALFLGIFAWLVRRVWDGKLDWIAGAGWAAAAMLATASSLLPWYVAWLMPLAALGRDRRLVCVSLVMTGVVLGMQILGYIPHGTAVA